MSTVTKLNSNEWTTIIHFSDPLSEKIQFADQPIVFNVHGEHIESTAKPHFKLTVAPELEILINQINYIVEYEVSLVQSLRSGGCSGFFDGTTTVIQLRYAVKYTGPVDIKLKLKKVALTQFFYTANADLKTYFEEGPTVNLVGSDGSVSVPRRLLKMRSKAFTAMFKHDTEEKRTGQIKMEDFNVKTLTAFKQLLMTGQVKDGKDTALGLVLLCDKYHIKSLKSAAEDFVKENFQEMDKEEVLDIFSKVSRKTLVDAMDDSWSKK